MPLARCMALDNPIERGSFNPRNSTVFKQRCPVELLGLCEAKNNCLLIFSTLNIDRHLVEGLSTV
jgi:hypothetical protein